MQTCSNRISFIYIVLGIHLVWGGSWLNYSGNDLTEVPPAPNNMTVAEINLENNAIQEIRWNAFRTYNGLAEISFDLN